jgi:CRISPR-associated protein Csx10
LTIARLGIRLTARQPVSMGTGACKAFHTTTHRHVPGSVWRGALAAAWIQRRGAPDPEFARVFDRDLRFGPLFADGTSLRPLSVRSCKYGSEHCADPWYWDAAFPDDAAGLPEGWDSPAGHWVGGRGEIVAGQIHTVASTAINPATGSAAERQLFSREALPAQTVFTGVVTGEQQALDLLAKASTDLDRLEVGGRGSVLGSVRLELTDAPSAAAPDTLSAARVVLRLTSPAFVVDAAGRPLTGSGLLGELRRLGYQGSIENSADGSPKIWSRPLTDATGGFHAATRMPKTHGHRPRRRDHARAAAGPRRRLGALAHPRSWPRTTTPRGFRLPGDRSPALADAREAGRPCP